MKPILSLVLAGAAALSLSACNGVYYGSGGYYEGPSYGYSGYDEPVLVQYDRVYISNDYYRVPVYRHRNDVYYVYNGSRHYFSPSERAKYYQAKAEYNYDKKRAEYRYDQARAEYKVDQNRYRLEQDLREKQARASYEQQKKQYQYNQKVAENRAEIQRASYRVEASQAKKQAEYQAKMNEARMKQAQAEWKAKNAYKSKDKKKKDD